MTIYEGEPKNEVEKEMRVHGDALFELINMYMTENMEGKSVNDRFMVLYGALHAMTSHLPVVEAHIKFGISGTNVAPEEKKKLIEEFEQQMKDNYKRNYEQAEVDLVEQSIRELMELAAEKKDAEDTQKKETKP
jgi:hypothetical protein